MKDQKLSNMEPGNFYDKLYKQRWILFELFMSIVSMHYFWESNTCAARWINNWLAISTIIIYQSAFIFTLMNNSDKNELQQCRTHWYKGCRKGLEKRLSRFAPTGWMHWFSIQSHKGQILFHVPSHFDQGQAWNYR